MEAKTETVVETQQKKCDFEIVEVPLTIKIPKPFLEFLENLAKMLNVTVEYILKEELYGLLGSFFQGGYLENWIEDYLFEDYVNVGGPSKGKALTDMIRQIDC